MLPKAFQLTPIEFNKFPKQAETSRLSFAKLLIKKGGKTNSRFAVIVPYHLDKRSVYRHRTKRVITQAITTIKQSLPVNLLVLIIVTKILSRKEISNVVQELNKQFQK